MGHEPVIHSVNHDEHPQYTHYIEIPLTADEMAAVQRAAEDRGLGPLLWARNAVRHTAHLVNAWYDDAAKGDLG